MDIFVKKHMQMCNRFSFIFYLIEEKGIKHEIVKVSTDKALLKKDQKHQKLIKL